MGIGKRIKEARERLNLTQSELGKIVGVTGSSITNYENETSHPKEPVLYKLLDGLNVDANYLFQDCFTKKEAPAISVKAMEVARAYEKADCGTQIAVCKILDLSPTEYRAPHIPDMQKIQKDAEAFAEYANKNLKMPVKK